MRLKNILSLILGITGFGIFNACQTDDAIYDGPNYIMFADTLTVLPIENNEDYLNIPISATQVCNYDRTFGLFRKRDAVGQKGSYFALLR